MKQVEYMYKSDEGELLKLTDYGQRNADTSTQGSHRLANVLLVYLANFVFECFLTSVP